MLRKILFILSFSMLVFLSICQLVRSETNLIVNGDFSQCLEGWQVVVVERVGNEPKVDITNATGNPALRLNTPSGSSAYVYQDFYFETTSFAILRFRVWAYVDPVRVRVLMGDPSKSVGELDLVKEFDPPGKRGIGGIPVTKSYNITKYSGQLTRLVFWSDSPDQLGMACAYVDDVKVEIVTEISSIITCLPDPIQLGLGQNTTMRGKIYPSVYANITLTYFRPDGSTVIRHVTNYEEKGYKDVYAPDESGIWEIIASWDGSNTYESATTLPVPFIIGQKWTLNATTEIMTINGVSVDLNEIEVLPGEHITGSITITSSVSFRSEVAQLVVFNTWERDRWDLLVWFLGDVEDVYGEGLDSFGIKRVLALPYRFYDVSTDVNKGAFVVEYGYQFPVRPEIENDVSGGYLVLVADHPTYVAPPESGTYYLVFYKEAQRSAVEVIYPTNRQFLPFENETVNSAWDLNNTHWSRVTLDKRFVDDQLVFTIPIHVIEGVDDAITSAQSLVDDLKANDLPGRDAEGNLSMAISEYNQRRFSSAKEYAENACDIANEVLSNYEHDTRERLSLVQNMLKELEEFRRIVSVAEISSLNRTLDLAELEFDSENYFKAMQLLGQIEDTIKMTMRSADMISAVVIIIVCGTIIYGLLDGFHRMPKVFEDLFRYLLLASAIGSIWQLLSISGIFTIDFFSLVILSLFSSLAIAIIISEILKHKYAKRARAPKTQILKLMKRDCGAQRNLIGS